MEKRIYLSHEGFDKLKTLFSVSRQSIWKALTYQTDSDIAKKIRYTAINQLGGVDTNSLNPLNDNAQPSYTNGSITDTGKMMVQTFANGVSLVIDKISGTIKLKDKNGEQHSVIEDASIKQIVFMQEMAKTMSV